MGWVQSLGAWWTWRGWSPSASYSAGSLQLYDRYYYDYATLYRTQPNVRTLRGFLARNIAAGLRNVFPAGERIRPPAALRDHGLAQTMRDRCRQSKVTRYRLIEASWATWASTSMPSGSKCGRGPLGLLRIPPPYMVVRGGWCPPATRSLGGKRRDFSPDQIVHFRGYNPNNPTLGLSPLETLRRILAEEQAMGDYREYFWQNAARISGIIERPLEAPDWSKSAQERFMAGWAEFYSGAVNSGKTPILQDGMTFKEASFNAQQSEYLGSRKLTREECARAYHIPLPMVGILDHAF